MVRVGVGRAATCLFCLASWTRLPTRSPSRRRTRSARSARAKRRGIGRASARARSAAARTEPARPRSAAARKKLSSDPASVSATAFRNSSEATFCSSSGFEMKATSTRTAGALTPIRTRKGACLTPRVVMPRRRLKSPWMISARRLEAERCWFWARSQRIRSRSRRAAFVSADGVAVGSAWFSASASAAAERSEASRER